MMAKPENENALTKGQSASLSVGADGVAFTRNQGDVQADIVRFVPRPRPLRADVPPFDPGNQAHLRAWESMWDLAQWEARNG